MPASDPKPARDDGSRAARPRAGVRRPFLTGLAAGLGYAVALFLAFPPAGLWWLAPVALLPIALVAAPGPRGVRMPLGVALGAAPMWLAHHAWLWPVTAQGLPILVVLLAAITAVAAWLLALLRRAWPAAPMVLLLPIVWVGIEQFRAAVLFDGYPWFLVAHPLVDFAPAAGMAAFGGVPLVGVVVAIAVGAVVDAADAVRRGPPGRWRRIGAAVAGAVVVAAGLAGGSLALLRAPQRPEPTAVIGVVQTNVPQDNREAWTFPQRLDDLRDFLALARRVADEGGPDAPLDLLVWPETMFPGLTFDEASFAAESKARLAFALDTRSIPTTLFRESFLALHRELDVPMVVGASRYEGFRFDEDGVPAFDARWNSAFLLDGGKITAHYDKLHLTPFGEVMPYISKSPAMERMLLDLGARGMAFDLERGETPVRLGVPRRRSDADRETEDAAPENGFRIATPICFEATMPSVCRRLVVEDGTRRADVLVNITNDGWFAGWDPGRWIHLMHCRWRAIELRTPVIRAANTGVSCAISDRGAVVELARSNSGAVARVPGWLRAEVGLLDRGVTMYARIGDAVGWTMLGLAALLPVVALVRLRAAATAREVPCTDPQ